MKTERRSPSARITRRGPHPVRFRTLRVLRKARLAPHYARITLGGDLTGFVSEGADDHVKLFFPDPGARAMTPPTLVDGRPRLTAEQRARMRDFTPRRYDVAAGELVIDFALHEHGVASEWARRAAVGDVLGAGGPRGSFVVRYDFDWYLLVGDEAGLPAIGRRLEELPAGAEVFVVAQVEGPDEELELPGSPTLRWIHRSRGDSLVDAVRALDLPGGDGFVFAGAENAEVRALREHVFDERGIPREHTRISAYWKRGAGNFHE